MSECHRCRRHIPPVIPGIVPAAAQIGLPLRILQIKCLLTVTGFVSEFSRIFFFQLHTAALEIKHPKCIPKDRRIDIFIDRKLCALIPFFIGKIILSGFNDPGKIDHSHLFAAVRILHQHIGVAHQYRSTFSAPKLCFVQRKFPAAADRRMLRTAACISRLIHIDHLLKSPIQPLPAVFYTT